MTVPPIDPYADERRFPNQTVLWTLTILGVPGLIILAFALTGFLSRP